MTGLVRKAILLSVCGLLFAGAAFASVPSATNSTLPAGVKLVGTPAGVADPSGQFTVTVRDLANNLIANSAVVIDVSGCTPDIKIQSTQPFGTDVRGLHAGLALGSRADRRLGRRDVPHRRPLVDPVRSRPSCRARSTRTACSWASARSRRTTSTARVASARRTCRSSPATIFAGEPGGPFGSRLLVAHRCERPVAPRVGLLLRWLGDQRGPALHAVVGTLTGLSPGSK